MTTASRRQVAYPVVLALVALALVAIVGVPPAWAASETQPANGATFNSNANWTPTTASRVFAVDNQCTGGAPPGGWIDVQFAAFSIPATDVIDGIEVRFNYLSASGTNTAQLKKSGGFVGATRTVPLQTGTSACSNTAWVTSGGPTDLWGATWSPADFNTSGTVEVRLTQNANTIELDAVEMIVYHSPGTNSPPVADAAGPYMVDEGGSVGLTGLGSSDPDGDPLTYAWDLDNDGAFDDATGATPTFSAAGRDGPDTQTIRLRVNDGTVDSAPDSATVTIKNVAPTITSILLSASSINEGQSVTVSGTFTDPALALESHTGSAAWSDGASTPVTVGSGTFSTIRTFPDDHPATGTASDPFTVAITIVDGDGGSDTATSPTVTVNNVAPSIGSIGLSAPSIDEGDSVVVSGSFSDPALGVGTEPFTGSALWSDGASTPVTVGAGTYSTSRTFVDDDPTSTASDTFTAAVTIADDDLGTDTATSPTLTVNNVAPVITSLTVTPMIDEDGTVSLTGAFTDVGVADTHSVSVAWGDSSASAAAVTQGAGSGTFSASHQYLDDDPTLTPQDTYTITVTVTDDDTGSATATVQTLVKNVAPVITAVASDATFADKAEEDEPVTVTGAFTDVGTLDTHSATVAWGDGTVTPAAVVQGSGSGTFSAGHSYAAGGVYTVTVTVIDDDTGAASATTLAVVTGVGVNGGVLQVVGTAGDDHVEVKPVKGEIDVFASFVSPKHRRFDAGPITAVEIWLCEGDDHADVHHRLSLPATIHGDDGDDNLFGGSGDDLLEGGDGNDRLFGRNGDDELRGGDGNDRLDGGKGDDSLFGEAGNDRLFGRQGSDLLDGGTGNDFLKD